MLDDLKSFFTNSSVAEVGVGVTIGAAFAGVIGAATDTGQALLQGDLEYAGLLKALITLLSVALLSLFGVVKPLLALRERMTRVQAAKVMDAAQQAKAGDLRGAVGTAREAGLPVPGGGAPAGADAAATGAAGGAAAETDGGAVTGNVEGVAQDAESLDAVTAGVPDSPAGDLSAAGTTDGAAVGGVAAGGTPGVATAHTTGTDPGSPDGLGAGTAGDPALSAPAGLASDPTSLGTDEGSALPTAGSGQGGSTPLSPLAGAPAAAGTAPRPDPLTAPLADLVPGGGATGGAAVAAGATGAPLAPAQPTSAAVAGAPGRPLPHGATDTKLCPYCAFDIPAVATRCGWCTSDLGDLERGPDPVVVQA